MALNIETFSNVTGGATFFKAAGHPKTAAAMTAWREGLTRRRVAIYDPLGFLAPLGEFYELGALAPVAVYGQDLSSLGRTVLGCQVQPVTDLPSSDAEVLLVAAFDAGRLIDHIRHLVPEGCAVESLDAVRLDDDFLTNPRNYLDRLNFATNFAFFRDGGGHHTRIVTCNYWSGYGARDTKLWLCLFDGGGDVLAEWWQPIPGNGAAVVVDSADVRQRFGLGAFAGQLFVHVVNGAGHDVVKYALDTYGDDDATISCTHDANAWPAAFYAGLPAARPGERVLFWLQNSHPCPVPAGAVSFNRMGGDGTAAYPEAVPAFASVEVDVTELLPGLAWPEQIEIDAGKHFVRPRYEVVRDDGRRRMAHVNVERTDLKPDPGLREIGNLMGKGFVLPAPILPMARFRSFALPTPMSTTQDTLPLAAIVYDPDGREVHRERFGVLPRNHATLFDSDAALNGSLNGGYGHVELVYDFADGGPGGGEGDGWLHGLFRYEDRETGHGADTSFGAHIFNTVLTYKNEPQSYAGRAPGLSTRLFLRLAPDPHDTVCHLIYAASQPWHATSKTTLQLHDAAGREVAARDMAIPCSGSRHWRYHETFNADERAAANAAGDGAYVVIRDLTCRLFGYHGTIAANAFSLDHMFGF